MTIQNNNGVRIGRFEKWEEQYMLENHRDSTWKDIARHLNRSTRSVMEKAKRLGIHKTNNYVKDPTTTYAELSPAQRRDKILSEFENSPDFGVIRQSFDVEELERYKAKWVEIMLTEETMTPTEKDAVHVMISNLIRMDRYQKMEKEHYERNKIAMRDTNVVGVPFSMHREIKEANELFIAAQKTLAMSRDQRIKREGDDRITILTLIKEFQDAKSRELLGREAAAFQHLKTKKLKELRNKGRIKGKC